MSHDDETRPAPRPSLFGDDRSAEETQVVQNPYPPAHRSDRRPSVQPPGTDGGYDRPGASMPSYGAQPPGRPGQPGGAGGGGLFEDAPPYQQPPGGGPTILANQAFDWERNLQEGDVVRSGRTGLIALFVLALVGVAVIALGLAAWSVLRGGGDDAASTDTGSETSTPTSEALTTSEVTVETTSTTVLDPNALQVVLSENPFTCDGETRQFATLSGATPNEAVAFTSPQASGLRSGQADGLGALPIRWQCDPTQAGTTWELTATGETSGKSVTFIFAGVSTPAAPAPVAGALTVDVIENPFVCDGSTRVFAGLTGADPNEGIAFSSPQTSGLRSGEADASGSLPIRWQCDPAQVGTTWELTATGETSGRTVTFTFTGS